MGRVGYVGECFEVLVAGEAVAVAERREVGVWPLLRYCADYSPPGRGAYK